VACLVVAAAGGMLLWGLWPSRRAPLVALVGAAGVGLTILSPRSPAAVAVFAAVIGAGSVSPRRLAAALAAAIGTGYLVANWLDDRAAGPLGLAFQALALVAAFSAVEAVRRIREERARAERLLLELRESREAQVEAARLAERARVAREIHDVLAHSLSALAVQLESARLLLEQRPGDPAAVAIITRAHALARQGIDDTRRALAALRGEVVAGPELIPRLCADFEAETGVPCSFEQTGDAVPLNADASLALYRVTQEALTNVRKHARPSSVAVRLSREADSVALTVEDTGAAAPTETSAAGSGGYGLIGMRERAELLGGRLDAAPTAQGFRVRLWLPI
jgi:signal transduction histidine kinase